MSFLKGSALQVSKNALIAARHCRVTARLPQSIATQQRQYHLNAIALNRLEVSSGPFGPFGPHRTYASSSPDNSEEFVRLRLRELVAKIESSPAVMAAFRDLVTILSETGLKRQFETGAQPSFVQILKMMSNKEVFMGIQRVKSEMDAANIEITKEEIMPLIASLKNKVKV